MPGPATASPQNAQLGVHRVSESERTPSPISKRTSDSGISNNATSVIHSQNPAPKPKLWSLAEIATSSDKCKGFSDTSQTVGTGQQITVHASSSSRTPFPHSAALSRHLYYASPFIPGYSNYGTFGHLHSSPGSNMGSATHLNGLHQTMLQRAEALARDSKLRSQTQLDICKDLTHHELKKGMGNV